MAAGAATWTPRCRYLNPPSQSISASSRWQRVTRPTTSTGSPNQRTSCNPRTMASTGPCRRASAGRCWSSRGTTPACARWSCTARSPIILSTPARRWKRWVRCAWPTARQPTGPGARWSILRPCWAFSPSIHTLWPHSWSCVRCPS